MPTSDFHNISSIVSLIVQLRPASILDVGCGFGKYGVLAREYLDVWHERLTPESWQTKIVGIEACETYRNPIYNIYSEVLFGEAQRIVPRLGHFDVVLIADVIEHIEKETARELVRECFRISPVVIISTPAEFFDQGQILGNPYEVHRSWWKADDFPSGIHVRTIRMISCNIFVASKDPIDWRNFALIDPTDYIYIRSRLKLGPIGLPVSRALRFLCRVFS